MLRKLFAVLAGALLLGVVISFCLPDHWRVERTLLVAAPAQRIAPMVAELREWPRWFPWGEKDDPTLVRTFSGAASGVGARMAWKGEKYGAGELEILTSDARGLSYRMSFGARRVEVDGEFRFTPSEGGTAVTWAEGGRIANPFARWFAASFETANGGDYQRGLLALQQLAEQPPGTPGPALPSSDAVPPVP
jgi:hypothetical protein